MIPTSLLLALYAAAASAQAPPTLKPARVDKIEIRMEGSSCTIRPQTIYLIFNDREERAATLLDGYWKWSDSENPIDLGVPKQAQLAVRFEGGRTRCRHYNDFRPTSANIGVAKFSFPACSIGAFDVTMQTDFEKSGRSPNRVSYVRELEADEGDPLGKPCKEALDFNIKEAHVFHGFWNDVEKISIFLYKPKNDPEGKLVPLNPLLKRKERLAKGVKAGPDRVAVLWAEDTVKKNPRLSPNEIDVDVWNLDDIHFKSLTLALGQK